MKYLSVCSGIEAATVAWKPLGWEAYGFSEIERFPNAVLQHHYPDTPNFGDMNDFRKWPEQTSMFSSEEHPANPSVSQALEKAWLTLEETSRLSIVRSLNASAPTGWYGKTCPVSCQVTKDGILAPLSGRWANSGIASPTECLTLSTSAFPSDVDVCSLSDVLETGEVPQKYFLSPKACAGILRRAESRGKTLPLALQKALEAVVAG